MRTPGFDKSPGQAICAAQSAGAQPQGQDGRSNPSLSAKSESPPSVGFFVPVQNSPGTTREGYSSSPPLPVVVAMNFKHNMLDFSIPLGYGLI